MSLKQRKIAETGVTEDTEMQTSESSACEEEQNKEGTRGQAYIHCSSKNSSGTLYIFSASESEDSVLQ